MSFSRSFTFHVSGSVSYPASEHGGSKTYHDSVNVVVEVDTSRFESSVQNCDRQVGALCHAVVSESSKLLEEKKHSARRISASLIGGFFKYIMYGISEKMMRLASRLPILQQTLRALASNCLAKRTQLERDYQQITSRYAAIFDDLDTSLKTALVALDSPVYQLTALTDKTVSGNCLNDMTSFVPVSGSEESNAVVAVELARLKSATRNVVAEGARNIRYNIELTSRIEHMLRKSAVPETHAYCMPVIKIAVDDLESGKEIRDEFFFPGRFPSARTDDLLNNLRASPEGEGARAFRQVGREEAGLASVDSFFKKRLSSAISQISDAAYGTRLSNEVLRMWDAVGRGKKPSAASLARTGTRRN